jgi:hypothetical protein
LNFRPGAFRVSGQILITKPAFKVDIHKYIALKSGTTSRVFSKPVSGEKKVDAHSRQAARMKVWLRLRMP